MEWYRRYHGTCADPKFRLVARMAAVPTPYAGFAWDALLEHASENEERGSLEGMDAELLSATTDITEPEAARLLEAFAARRMIVKGRIASWTKRQPESDNSTARVRAWRERNKQKQRINGEETLHETLRNVSQPLRNEQNRTEQKDSDSSLRSESRFSEAPKPDLKKLVFDRGLKLLGGDKARPHLGRMLREFGTGAVFDAVAQCEREEPAEPRSFIEGVLRNRAKSAAAPNDWQKNRNNPLNCTPG